MAKQPPPSSSDLTPSPILTTQEAPGERNRPPSSPRPAKKKSGKFPLFNTLTRKDREAVQSALQELAEKENDSKDKKHKRSTSDLLSSSSSEQVPPSASALSQPPARDAPVPPSTTLDERPQQPVATPQPVASPRPVASPQPVVTPQLVATPPLPLPPSHVGSFGDRLKSPHQPSSARLDHSSSTAALVKCQHCGSTVRLCGAFCPDCGMPNNRT
eukprot:TRINITY_DN3462_c0_g1_i1.p3 TRINITY_DN3462_c0_g1~~TRINITY_DN3462_c0_g1_i1.p3  ORF type:complete len:215 (-),score=49.52 TRINITY_DN3462_c0_g1_i1:67-711(-)